MSVTTYEGSEDRTSRLGVLHIGTKGGPGVPRVPVVVGLRARPDLPCVREGRRRPTSVTVGHTEGLRVPVRPRLPGVLTPGESSRRLCRVAPVPLVPPGRRRLLATRPVTDVEGWTHSPRTHDLVKLSRVSKELLDVYGFWAPSCLQESGVVYD